MEVSTEHEHSPLSVLPCTWQPVSHCEGCQANGQLMCRFEKRDMLHFFMILFPFGVTAILGTIHAGYGKYLWLWLAYSLFFFFVWEARVLCRHCPYWAEPGRFLRCHANYGVLKIWSYEPGPMSKSEKLQFLIGALIWVAFPFPFLWLGKDYFLLAVALSAAASGVFLLKRNVCTRCINFSCPLNGVPKRLAGTYLRLNPDIQAAWEAQGYHPDEV